MTKEQLERLLNTACEIITSLEDSYFYHHSGDEDMKIRIDALFNEIKHSDQLDADMEAQAWDVFGEGKI